MPSVLLGTMHGDNIIQGAESTWLGEVGNIIPDYTKFVIEPIVSFSNNTISAKYEITERNNPGYDLRFYAFIVEDHIEGPQAGTTIDPYDHRHVLRKCFSSLSGNSVSFNNGSAVLNLDVVVNENWDLNNVYVVGIIVDATTMEVYSGEQRKLFE